MRTVYASVEALGIELTAGRESLWWGPGHHGALLASNNAEPISMLRLTNPPCPPTMDLRFLESVTTSSRAAWRMTGRMFQSPIHWGMRLSA